MSSLAIESEVKRLSAPNQDALRTYDGLPDSANVGLPVVMAICGVSAATVWRHAKSGKLPRPKKIGGATRWNVGELRNAVAAFPEVA